MKCVHRSAKVTKPLGYLNGRLWINVWCNCMDVFTSLIQWIHHGRGRVRYDSQYSSPSVAYWFGLLLFRWNKSLYSLFVSFTKKKNKKNTIQLHIFLFPVRLLSFCLFVVFYSRQKRHNIRNNNLWTSLQETDRTGRYQKRCTTNYDSNEQQNDNNPTPKIPISVTFFSSKKLHIIFNRKALTESFQISVCCCFIQELKHLLPWYRSVKSFLPFLKGAIRLF